MDANVQLYIEYKFSSFKVTTIVAFHLTDNTYYIEPT